MQMVSRKFFQNFMNCEIKEGYNCFSIYRWGDFYLADFSNRISKNLMNDYQIENSMTNFLNTYCKDLINV